MFAYIKGKLEIKTDTFIVIDVQGIGYKIFMPAKSINKIGEIQETVKVHIYHYVREDNISLYGFITNEELKIFELLLSVSGVGAKSAIIMLSEISPSSFALAVISNDITKLVKIPGIGKKTAARIILELKDKLKKEQTFEDEEDIDLIFEDDNKSSEAIAALQVLGYTKKDVEQVMKKIDINKLELEEIIKQSLKYLAGN